MTTVTEAAESCQLNPCPATRLRTARRWQSNMRLLLKSHELKNGSTMDWMADPDRPMACDGVITQRPELDLDSAFFPSDPVADRRWEATKQTYCDHCPVAYECYEFAIANDYVGLWGGKLITHKDVKARNEARLADRRRRRHHWENSQRAEYQRWYQATTEREY